MAKLTNKSYGAGERTIQEEKDGIDALLKHIDVDIVSGVCVWRIPTAQCVSVGEIAGFTRKNQYHIIKFDSQQYQRHRIVFYVAYGYLPFIVDHINGVEYGDGVDNLQEVTSSQNMQKKRIYNNNTSGTKGVFYRPDSGKWRAQINCDGERINIGTFITKQEAIDARKAKALELFGKYYNG